jgi:SRSO17 transposase
LRGVLAESVAAPLAWVIDDTSIVKKGVKSPGVHRQYTGTAGKNENCQIVVSTHLAGHDGSGPVAMDLYLPKVWCEDTARRTEAWIPTQVSFRTKLDIALAQLDHLQAVGESNRVVLADAGYGKSTTFRVELDARGLDFIVGVPGAQHLWRVGQGPDPPPIVPGGPGRPKTRSLPGTYKTISITDLVRELEPSEWKVIDLRPATPGVRTSRFAFVRGVRSAHGASKGRLPGPHRVLIAEWPDGDNKPSHYFIASANAQSDDADLARLAKLRWRVERDYQDLKQEVGLTHYEGRRWPGFHHHLTVCMAAITYLIAARATSPPG